MTQYSAGPAARPRMASTGDTQARQARYLEALAGLSPHHAHDVRGLLGSVTLHLDVAGELLTGDGTVPPAAVERARVEIGRARAGLKQVLDALEALVGLTRSRSEGSQRFDLRDLVQELGMTLAPTVHERKLEWSAPPAGPPAYVTGERDALRQAMLIIVVEMLLGLASPGRLEFSLTSAGDRVELAIAGVSPSGARAAEVPAGTESSGVDPFEILRTTFQSNGGDARSDGGARIVLTLPASHTTG